MKEQLLDWWINKDKLTDDEQRIAKMRRPEDIVNSFNYNNIIDEYFRLMPCCNLTSDTHKIEVAPTARELITKLFTHCVDDDTLIIYSSSEHQSVVENVNRFKHSLSITTDEIQQLNFSNILREIKNYKKVFVYIIGTEISTGRIIPQKFYTRIKQILVNNNKEHVIVSDDVHGMFITPRDYSIFDYIIGTAHALVVGYNMGIIITKKENPEFGIIATNWLEEYLKPLNVVLSRKEKLYDFYKVISMYLEDYVYDKRTKLLPNITPNIFALRIPKTIISEKLRLQLREYQIKVEGYNVDNTQHCFIRMRGQQFITDSSYLKPGLELLKGYLDFVFEMHS